MSSSSYLDARGSAPVMLYLEGKTGLLLNFSNSTTLLDNGRGIVSSDDVTRLMSAGLGPLLQSALIFLLLDIVFIRLFAKKWGYEFSCRITSIIHSIASTLVALNVCRSAPSGVFDSYIIPLNPLSATRPEEAVAIAVSAGYFIADTLMMLAIAEMRSVRYFIHHGISLVGCCIPIFLGRYGAVTTASLFWLESTNPHLNLRWLLMSVLRLDCKQSDAEIQAAADIARKTQPMLFSIFDVISKLMLLQFIPARTIFLPVASYRAAVDLFASPETVDLTAAAQGTAALILTVFSIKFFLQVLYREIKVGPGSWE